MKLDAEKRVPPRSQGMSHRTQAMRRDTLTLQARYVFPVEGPPIADGVVTLQQGRIGWVGPSRGTRRRPRPGQRGDRARVRQRPHPPRTGESRRRRTGAVAGSEDEIAWLRRVVDQRRTGSEQSLTAMQSARNLEGVHRGGDDAAGRHDDGRAELGRRWPLRPSARSSSPS